MPILQNKRHIHVELNIYYVLEKHFSCLTYFANIKLYKSINISYIRYNSIHNLLSFFPGVVGAEISHFAKSAVWARYAPD